MKPAIKLEPNPIQELLEIREVLSRYKKLEDQLKSQIFSLMDSQKTDRIVYGDNVAERTLVVQSRLDTKKAKELLGENAPLTEVEQIKLAIL